MRRKPAQFVLPGCPISLKMVILNLLRIIEEFGMIIALKRPGLSRTHRAI